MTDKNTGGYAYQVVSDSYEHEIQSKINRLAREGWEPFLYSASANVKPSVSGTGLHACVLRKPLADLPEFERERYYG